MCLVQVSPAKHVNAGVSIGESDNSSDIFEHSDDDQGLLNNSPSKEATTPASAKCSSNEHESPSTPKRRRVGDGRPKSLVWNAFNEEIIRGQRITRCKTCNKKVSAKANRLYRHLKSCEKSSQSSASSVSVPFTVSAPESRSPRLSKQSATFKQYFDVMTPSDKQVIDERCANWIYCQDLPFNTVEDKEFREFIALLRPAYKPPSKYEISGKLLDNAYDNMLMSLNDAISGKKVTIMQDGWSTVQNDPVIVHAISDGTRTVFLNAVPSGDNLKDATFCLKLLKEAMRFAEEKFKVKIVACVTDNCSTMRLLREKLEQIEPDILVYGCNAHLLNLIGRDLSKVELTDRIKTVQKFYRNHHMESASMKLLKGKRPVLPCDTRWSSQIEMYKNYQENHAKYLDISRKLNSGVRCEPSVKAIINDMTVFPEVSRMIDYLSPVNEALTKVNERALWFYRITNVSFLVWWNIVAGR